MKERIRSLLNKQITNELESAYLYLGFANFFDSKGLEGYSNYYKVQAKEEIGHAMRIYKYLHQNSEIVKLANITINYEEFDDIDFVLACGLNAERTVTKSIEEIYKASIEEEDYKTAEFIGWFINEQIEEEASAQKMIDDKYNFTDLYLLDKEYKTRRFEQ